MFEKLDQLFSMPKFTIISGFCISVSLALLLSDTYIYFDPAWATILISGYPLLYAAITRLIYEKTISSALLISIAMIASIAIGEVFAAGEIAFIMAIGELLEDRTVEKAKKGIKELINLAPRQGRRIIFGENKSREEIVTIEEINLNDHLRVLPGEAIPVDGHIIIGNTSIDQSVMTGESLPVDKTTGDEVFSGTINRFGTIDIKATKVGEDSSLQKLIRMVQEAENNKAPMQRIVDKWASMLVPIALLIAIVTYFITGNITRAVTVLVVFCPCALALATPTSIMAAIGQATKHGVLIKSGEALENMGKVDCVAFDKTGTLTHGRLAVSDCISLTEQISDEEILSLAASVEVYSEHPLAKAIVAFAQNNKSELKEITDFNMQPGRGIGGKIGGEQIYCGNASYLAENSISLPDSVGTILNQLRSKGRASVLVANSKICLGIVALTDVVRQTAKEMVFDLKQTGTDIVLLTGDHAQTASYFAQQVDIDEVYSELLPDQKVSKIKQLQSEGHTVAMIGDGVNDAPALKTADVGVAMASMGSDIAIDAADIALIGDDISKLPYLKKLSNATIRTIKFNIAMSMLLNFVAIILSVMGILNPISGALVHNAGSVLVVLNAARLYDRKFIGQKEFEPEVKYRGQPIL